MMKESAKKVVVNIQKVAIGFCAIATLAGVSGAVIAKHQKDTESYAKGTAVALLGGLALGMTTKGYLSNPFRKREHD